MGTTLGNLWLGMACLGVMVLCLAVVVMTYAMWGVLIIVRKMKGMLADVRKEVCQSPWDEH